ncbi:hypothetical protein [Sulfurimonas sp.]|uniref:hypothetical protein n=1 Tax=Sulfurimonas sp. TaxID=2022749 RepID=UPI00286EA9BC|nr:hypothetical protein [Sulfurimonas sp.]
MSEENINTFDIECPHCLKDNKINLSKNIKCKHCEKPLIGERYIKPIISTFATILIGAGIGMTADGYLNINRASVLTEYKMMKTCIYRFGNYKTVRDNCACAVESMLGIVDAQKARLYGEKWLLDILDDKYKDCEN